MQKLYGHDIWEGFQPSTTESEIQGWNGDHPSLDRLVSTAGDDRKIVIDVGVWKGQSTITMGHAMRRAGIDGCVIAVDTFLGSPEHWSGPAALFSRVNGLPDLYQTFLSNVRKAGLTRYIVPMPQTSSTAALILARLQITASIVHVDAAHEYEDVMRDAAAYWALLRPGGYLIGDDYHETWPGVVRAAGEFSAKVKRPLTVDAPKWILQKAPA
ncbi:MAG TPA: class I SAM-dependent methyltransferase [Stellaceae bacterium]|nr:class I SAM-dependent methyltransferase [Stellaceae bacterium]